MKVKLDDIPESGLKVDEALPRDYVDDFLPAMQELHAEAPGHAQLRLERQGENISVTGTASVAVAGVCAGCLEPVKLPLTAKLSVVLFKHLPDAPSKDEDDDDTELDVDGSLLDGSDQDDDGAGRFDGKVIDWGDIVRQQLLLVLPIAPRCKDDCQGLCPVCGCDRNITQCKCETKTLDPRWDKLREIKLGG